MVNHKKYAVYQAKPDISFTGKLSDAREMTRSLTCVLLGVSYRTDRLETAAWAIILKILCRQGIMTADGLSSEE